MQGWSHKRRRQKNHWSKFVTTQCLWEGLEGSWHNSKAIHSCCVGDQANQYVPRRALRFGAYKIRRFFMATKPDEGDSKIGAMVDTSIETIFRVVQRNSVAHHAAYWLSRWSPTGAEESPQKDNVSGRKKLRPAQWQKFQKEPGKAVNYTMWW